MKIKTITCHDVYNVGASLQAYALQRYLSNLGNEVEIIDYKPEYLLHYRLMGVNNPVYNRPILREMYQLMKLPGRLKARRSIRKKKFDVFREDYLRTTPKTYHSIKDLKKCPPIADMYIAGSDQIWNPLFKNGRDPSFFLQFGDEFTRRVSYAASFATDWIEEPYFSDIQEWLQSFDSISVREKSGLRILESMGYIGIQVCDPVFLLEKDIWESLEVYSGKKPYLFVYDFDNNKLLHTIAKQLAEKYNWSIISVNQLEGADEIVGSMGPREFLGYIKNAEFIISNSFHATAFSLIFNKNFYVLNRNEMINMRMSDLLSDMGLDDRIISSEKAIDTVKDIIGSVLTID